MEWHRRMGARLTEVQLSGVMVKYQYYGISLCGQIFILLFTKLFDWHVLLSLCVTLFSYQMSY